MYSKMDESSVLIKTKEFLSGHRKTGAGEMQVPGDEKPVIKAGYHPLLLGFFWVLILSMIVLVLQRPDRDMILTIMIMALIFLGFQLSTTSYDKERKILTRRIYGFPFKYDMSRCKAKAVL